jgi:hypothetical protein
MPQPPNEDNRQALVWLEQFSRELDADPDVLDTLTIEEVQAELQALGADVEGFHARLAATFRKAKLKKAASTLIHWISPLWQPQWAGQFVGAGDIPGQTHLQIGAGSHRGHVLLETALRRNSCLS